MRTVLFDFDYTLADASPAIVACTNYALETQGLPAAAPEDIRQTIGLTLEDAFAQLVGTRVPADRFPAASKAFDHLFIARADAIMADRTVILPHVAGAIRSLKRRGSALGIVTSKFRYRVEQVLEREELRGEFEVIVGREDVIASKPDPEGLFTAMSALGALPENSCYVGDSVTDAKTAQRAGAAFIAVLTGVTPRAEFRGYAHRSIIANLAELADAIGC